MPKKSCNPIRIRLYDLKYDLKNQAIEEDRNLSQYIYIILKRHLINLKKMQNNNRQKQTA